MEESDRRSDAFTGAVAIDGAGDARVASERAHVIEQRGAVDDEVALVIQRANGLDAHHQDGVGVEGVGVEAGGGFFGEDF